MAESLLATANHTPSIVGKGVVQSIRATRVGQLFTADWKTELILAGYGYNVTVGTLTAGAAYAGITGGGGSTTVDSDQPEMAIGTPDGYYHVPLAYTFTSSPDLDADAEFAEAVLFVDTAKIIPAPIAASSTVETPEPLLGGAGVSVSRAQSAVTTDIADPVASVVLAYSRIAQAQVTAASVANAGLDINWVAAFPQFFKGPCSVISCWGGTAAVVGACSYWWAEIPAARFE